MHTHHLFPWWAGYLLISPLRKLMLDPRELPGGYITPGMTLLDAGCAMGYFSIPMAEMTGPGGRVLCVDPQERMLRVLKRRAKKAGVSGIIETRLCSFDSLLLDECAGRVDLTLAFGVLHEVRDRKKLIREIADALKPGGLFIFGEPHVVSKEEFTEELAMIEESGFATMKRWRKGRTSLAVLRKSGAAWR
ncbi:MAG: class I SAM-dependent methyltransferase [Spirochaetes bacterium]|nr:class I SAM-dependent methyltransferase [Spirochaetota bacterium]